MTKVYLFEHKKQTSQVFVAVCTPSLIVPNLSPLATTHDCETSLLKQAQ